jgi:hypothetical protein
LSYIASVLFFLREVSVLLCGRKTSQSKSNELLSCLVGLTNSVLERLFKLQTLVTENVIAKKGNEKGESTSRRTMLLVQNLRLRFILELFFYLALALERCLAVLR